MNRRSLFRLLAGACAWMAMPKIAKVSKATKPPRISFISFSGKMISTGASIDWRKVAAIEELYRLELPSVQALGFDLFTVDGEMIFASRDVNNFPAAPLTAMLFRRGSGRINHFGFGFEVPQDLSAAYRALYEAVESFRECLDYEIPFQFIE